ncbi:hypothetical protein [Staphylococcus sp. GDY8P57P]|uniref:hypothetical protein n=1 Tax=Staphylococcus sp. GDY8P57P TaxID=2804128 RepID=UPI001882C5F4|nr:hypothetical protein [Staphylococcus sp. GDY8P57P]MBF2756832.1 hypothetical protein [Staphylococcus haemolyticus]MBF2772887.1 hypothetical protein [Staphylococcus haemolyticus]MBF2775497.1 hypothetical protein [Staphylococcus haemolyticus]MBF2814798.1 hypothetical protein [Staphylococcus haemolyticus]MBF9720059.1 hypothetical protein [Staphylococcus haemolyticus]
MTVTLSQKSYNALLDDLEKLRKCNIDLEEKLNKEIKLSYEIEGNLYDVSKERDKIIDDMAEVKRKAEAFDFISNFYTTEIEQAIKNKELNQCLFLLDQILGDLERGSDE